jgi:hypothetical protein
MDRSSIRAVAEDDLNSLGGKHDVLFLTTRSDVVLVQLGHPKANDPTMAECDRRTTSRARISLWLGMMILDKYSKCTVIVEAAYSISRKNRV